MPSELPRPPISALLLTELGTELGVAPAAALAGTGLCERDLRDVRAEVTADQELRVIGNLLEALDDPPGLGLRAGARYHLTAYGSWSFMVISSPTLRSAVDLALRFRDLTFAFCDVTARERGDELQFVLTAEDVPARLRRFVVEREAAAIRTIQREAVPNVTLRGVRFGFPAPDDDPAHEILGVAPDYGADEHVLTYDVAALDEPMPQANQHAAAVARAQCHDLLQQRRARTGLSGRVRELVAEALPQPPDAERAAAAMHLSVRTLQRRLAREGTSFRALVDEVREQLADELLATGGLPAGEVARRLGYLEPSSFSQAFRRWKGVGPREFARTRRRP